MSERLRRDGSVNPNYEDEWVWINKRSGVAHLNRVCPSLIQRGIVPDGALRVVRRQPGMRVKRCRFCWPSPESHQPR